MGNRLFNINIAKLIKDYIGPGVLPATLKKFTPGTRTPGSLTAGTQPTSLDYACRGFINKQATRNREGQLVDDGSLEIILIGDTINGGATSPSTNDLVTIEGEIYTIEGIDRDPAAATYTLRVRAR